MVVAGGKRVEGVLVAFLVAPVEDVAFEAELGERAQFEIGHDRGYPPVGEGKDDQRAFVLVKVLIEQAAEIGARHQGDGIEPMAVERNGKRCKTCRQHRGLPN